jgi:DNA repair photolyase
VVDRFRVLEETSRLGLKTAIMFGPLLPWLSDSQDSLDAMFQRAADLQVEVVWVDALNPRPRVWPAVSQLLRDRFPDLLERYRQMLFESGARSRYLAELGQRVQRAAERVSLQDRIIPCF